MATQVVPAQKVHFKDEGKDTLGDVLRDPNRQAMSGDTGTFFEPLKEEAPIPETPAPPVEAPTIAPATETGTAPAPTISTSTAPPPPAEAKLYAGKFKTTEDLEKAYKDIEAGFTKKAQEAATARKALEERERIAPVTAKPAEETEAQRLARINEMLTDPDAYFAKQARLANDAIETERNLRRQSETLMDTWRDTNKDMTGLLEIGEEKIPLEQFVGAEMARITATDPDMDPMAALNRATTNIRAAVGILIDRGRKEALSVQSSVTQTAPAKINTPPPTEQPPQAPKTDEQQRSEHLDFLRGQAASVRRPVR